MHFGQDRLDFVEQSLGKSAQPLKFSARHATHIVRTPIKDRGVTASTYGRGLYADRIDARQPSHVTVATASLIGTAIEWYDFFLYGTAAALTSTSCSFRASIRLSERCWPSLTFALGFSSPVRSAASSSVITATKIGRKPCSISRFAHHGRGDRGHRGLLPTYETDGRRLGRSCS